MGAPAEELLVKLEPGVEIAAGKVRGLAAAAPALAEAGLLVTRKQGRTLMVSLTDAGVTRRASLPAPAPAPSAKPRRGANGAAAKAPTPAQRLAALEAAVADLSARLAAVEAARQGSAPAEPAALGDTVLDAVSELDARHRYGGLVPLPDVRAELRRRGVAADDTTVNAALEILERAWKIDLSVAQSPTQVADRAAGIERPGRGLLYYVARR
jgi:hypothetical protein